MDKNMVYYEKRSLGPHISSTNMAHSIWKMKINSKGRAKIPRVLLPESRTDPNQRRGDMYSAGFQNCYGSVTVHRPPSPSPFF